MSVKANTVVAIPIASLAQVRAAKRLAVAYDRVQALEWACEGGTTFTRYTARYAPASALAAQADLDARHAALFDALLAHAWEGVR